MRLNCRMSPIDLNTRDGKTQENGAGVGLNNEFVPELTRNKEPDPRLG